MSIISTNPFPLLDRTQPLLKGTFRAAGLNTAGWVKSYDPAGSNEIPKSQSIRDLFWTHKVKGEAQ